MTGLGSRANTGSGVLGVPAQWRLLSVSRVAGDRGRGGIGWEEPNEVSADADGALGMNLAVSWLKEGDIIFCRIFYEVSVRGWHQGSAYQPAPVQGHENGQIVMWHPDCDRLSPLMHIMEPGNSPIRYVAWLDG